MKAGDVLAFGGSDLVGAFISLATFGIPYRSAAHVGIIVEVDGKLRLIESTIDSHEECLMRRVHEPGVKVTGIRKRIERYIGKIWHWSLSRPLYDFENARLTSYVLHQIGKPYDVAGAVKAGGYLLAKAKNKHDEPDLSRLFCSELVAACHTHIGIFHTSNPARWSPNSLLRTEHRHGVLTHPKRIK